MQPPRRRPGSVSLEDGGRKRGQELTGIHTWQVTDVGLRCIAAPCPTYQAIRIEGDVRHPAETFHEVRFENAKLSEAEARGAQASLGRGLLVEATVRWIPNRGPAGDARVLEVQRVVPRR